jgi:hypothetical protein
LEQQGNDCLNSNRGKMKAESSRGDGYKEDKAVDFARSGRRNYKNIHLVFRTK